MTRRRNSTPRRKTIPSHNFLLSEPTPTSRIQTDPLLPPTSGKPLRSFSNRCSPPTQLPKNQRYRFSALQERQSTSLSFAGHIPEISPTQQVCWSRKSPQNIPAR